jgi:isoleucyl-tRNA synthetase
VVVSETPRSGWAVASAGSDTVALDLELSHELRLAGLLREIVRLVQEGRKSGGLESATGSSCGGGSAAPPDPAEAIRTHQDRFAAEVLATVVHEGEPGSRCRSRCMTPSSVFRSGPAGFERGGRPPLNLRRRHRCTRERALWRSP